MNDNVAASLPEQDLKQAAEPALDELLMAMDVVDTLRHQEQVAIDELEQDGKDTALKERLRNLYESQGLTVSEEILDEGIRALKEDRFTYHPRSFGFARTMAGIWINRKRYIRVGMVAFGLLIIISAGSFFVSHWQQARDREFRVELQETLPREIVKIADQIRNMSHDPEAMERAAAFQAQGQSALNQNNLKTARVAVQDLQELYQNLTQTYNLRIVSEPGSLSAVYRIPKDNGSIHNYYLIVEAIDPRGVALAQNVLSEETNKTKSVKRWGQRVPLATYEMIRRDKQDDGIIQKNIIGRKQRGYLKPDFLVPVQNGAITEW